MDSQDASKSHQEQVAIATGATNSEPTTIPQPPNPRLIAIAAKQATLEETLASLLVERANLVSSANSQTNASSTANDDEQTRAALASANVTIKHHIKTLHRYNEVKDVGQGLMGLVAEARGTRVKDVMEDFGLDEGD